MTPRRTRIPGRLTALVALAVLCLGAGCARLSVSHLDPRPLVVGGTGTETMKYFGFTYVVVLDSGAYGLRGRATPVPAALPAWADRLEELTITAYLSDPSGRVLAQAEKTYPGMALAPGATMPFSFRLLPDEGLLPGSLAVSFGYKAVFGSSAARQTLPGLGPPPAGTVFFAGEGALLVQ
jgi:hypothetical protein